MKVRRLGCAIFSDLIHNNVVVTIVTIVRFVIFIACRNSLSMLSAISNKHLCQILLLAGWQQYPADWATCERAS